MKLPMPLKRSYLAAGLLGAALLSVLVSCSMTTVVSPFPAAAAPVTDRSARLETTYDSLRNEGGRVMVLQAKESTIRIFAFRAGQAAKLGHNHVLSAPRFEGFFYLPAAGTASARFDLEFRLDELRIDDPAIRSTLGPAFSSLLTAAAIEGTREHMLGPDNLEADRFPFVRIHSIGISGEAPKFAASVEVELHGQKRVMVIPLSVDGLPDRLSVAGSFVLRQSDFGAKPYSVLGGLIAVQDDVVVEFQLSGS